MTKTYKLLFIGAYGIQNAGDDLPLIVIKEWLEESSLNFKFNVLSRHPNSWEEKEYGVQMIKNLEYESRESSIGKWFQGLNFGDDQKNICKVKRLIEDSDVLIIGAGNFLIDISFDIFRGPISLMAVYIFLAKLYNKKIMIYGLSAGPITNSFAKDLASYILNSADLVTVRDELSKVFIEKHLNVEKNIEILPDSTIGVNKLEQNDTVFLKENIPFEGKPVISFGLRDSKIFKDSNAVEQSIIQTVNKLKSRYRFIFVPQSTYGEDDDRAYAQKLIKKIDADVEVYIIKNRYAPKYLISVYEQSFLTIAIRLHAAVFSFIANTPVIALNYLPKVKGFMQSSSLEEFLH